MQRSTGTAHALFHHLVLDRRAVADRLGGRRRVVFAAVRSQTAANQNSAILADFKARLDAYAALHRKMEESLPKLSQEATPAEIDLHQRSLLTRISTARGAAKQGDVFTPPVRSLIRAVIAETFARGNSATLRESIQDENPGR